MRNIDDLVSMSAACRERVNPYLFNYALSVAILHRPDTRNLQIPPLFESFPDKFMDGAIFNRARQESEIFPSGSRVCIYKLQIDLTKFFIFTVPSIFDKGDGTWRACAVVRFNINIVEPLGFLYLIDFILTVITYPHLIFAPNKKLLNLIISTATTGDPSGLHSVRPRHRTPPGILPWGHGHQPAPLALASGLPFQWASQSRGQGPAWGALLLHAPADHCKVMIAESYELK